jgi:NAD(P)-dependent dehydrogenase (short-subunit alcohol dehydrogenase family)
MNLNECRVVVTGGLSGLGQACVEALRAKGAKVVSWDIQKSTNSQQIQCDVTNEASVNQALAQTIEQIGIPNVCIQCAGIAPGKRIVGKQGAMPLEEFSKVIAVNLIGTFNVMRLVAEKMSTSECADDQSRGVFIHTASVAAFEGQIGQAAYSASKGGVAALTLPAARELAQHNIRVNTIAPGLMATPMLFSMSDEVKVELAKNIPYPKRLGHPQEYAQLAIQLIENEYINGETIRLDGGLRMTAR